MAWYDGLLIERVDDVDQWRSLDHAYPKDPKGTRRGLSQVQNEIGITGPASLWDICKRMADWTVRLYGRPHFVSECRANVCAYMHDRGVRVMTTSAKSWPPRSSHIWLTDGLGIEAAHFYIHVEETKNPDRVIEAARSFYSWRSFEHPTIPESNRYDFGALPVRY